MSDCNVAVVKFDPVDVDFESIFWVCRDLPEDDWAQLTFPRSIEHAKIIRMTNTCLAPLCLP